MRSQTQAFRVALPSPSGLATLFLAGLDARPRFTANPERARTFPSLEAASAALPRLSAFAGQRPLVAEAARGRA